MKMKREFKSRWLLLSGLMMGFLFFSLHAQGQQTTTTTTTATPAPDDDDDYDHSPRVGLKGGVNFTNFISDEPNDNHGKIGWHAGIYGQLFSSEVFAIQPELNFSVKGNEVTHREGVIDQETNFNLSYLDIPVLAVFKLGRAVELHAGPYWGYLLGANIDSDGDLSDDFRELDRDNFENWDYGLAGGLGFNLGAVQLGARYNYGLNEIAQSRGARALIGGNTKNSVGQIYLAFNLGHRDNDLDVNHRDY